MNDDEILDHLRNRANQAEPRPDLAGVKAGLLSAPGREADQANGARRRARWIAVAAALTLLVGGLTFALWPVDGPDTSTGPAAEGGPAASTTSNDVAEPEVNTVAGSWLVGRGDPQVEGSPFTEPLAPVMWETSVVSGETNARVSAIAAANDDVVVAGTGEGQVVALDTATGETRWSADLTAESAALEDYNSYAMYPALNGDTVYVAASTGVVHALDLDTGDIRWSSEVLGLFGGFPVVVDGMVVVGRSWWDIYDDRVDYSGRGALTRGGVAGLDADTGVVVWERHTDLQTFVSAGPPGTVLVSSFDNRFVGNGSLQVVDAASGVAQWTVEGLDGDAPPTYGDGVIVVAASNVVAFDVDGVELWRTAPDWGGSFHFPVAVGDTLALVTNGAGIYGLDLQTGRTCWGYSIGDNYAISYPGPQGVAAFATGPGAVWINTRTGETAGFLPVERMALSISSTSHGEVLAGLDGVVRLVGPIAESSTPDRDVACAGPAARVGPPTEPAPWPLAILDLLDSAEDPGWELRSVRHAVEGSFSGRYGDSMRWVQEYERPADRATGVAFASVLVEGYSVGVDEVAEAYERAELTELEPINGFPAVLLVNPLTTYAATIAVSVADDFTVVLDSQYFDANELPHIAAPLMEVDAAEWATNSERVTERSLDEPVAAATSTTVP